MISRRRFAGLALSALTAAERAQARVSVPRIGVSGYSFQALSLDESIAATKQLGIGSTEVWFRHIEPRELRNSREALRQWRMKATTDMFRAVGRKYESAGIEMVAFTFDMKDDFDDAELEYGFRMARALGVNRIATSTTLNVASRIVPLMSQYRMAVAFHGHANAADPNEFAGPESFRKVLRLSPYARINLDIGQFVAAGFDPLPFIAEQHRNIPVLHIRDGAPGRGTKLVWGSGATPIREVLQLIRRERYAIAADIEYDYGGAADPLTEVARCLDYCRATVGRHAQKTRAVSGYFSV